MLYPLLGLLHLYAAAGNKYASDGMMKTTYASSNPQVVGAWIEQYSGLQWTMDPRPGYGNFTSEDGALYRLNLCKTKDNCTLGDLFGVHIIKAPHRPGASTVSSMEAHFDAKLAHAATYDAFHDFSTAIYVSDLNPLVSKFKLQNGGKPPLALRWTDDSGAVWHSIMVHVPRSFVIWELISENKPDDVEEVVDELVRVPSEVFALNNHSGEFGKGGAVVLAASRATSNLSTSVGFYEHFVFGSTIHRSTAKGASSAFVKLPTANIIVRLTERPLTNTSGSFTVKDLEDVKNRIHNETIKNATYGVDQYFDNHIAVRSTANFTAFSHLWDEAGVLYHAWGWDVGGPLYAVEQPTGEVIQVLPPDYRVTPWTHPNATYKSMSPSFVQQHGLPCGCPINFKNQGECGMKSVVDLPQVCEDVPPPCNLQNGCPWDTISVGCTTPRLEVEWQGITGYSGVVSCGNLFRYEDIAAPKPAPVVKYQDAKTDAFYTMMMIDFDSGSAPFPNATGPGPHAPVRHWVAGNILGAKLAIGDLSEASEVAAFQNPRPLFANRYGFFLMEQPNGRIEFETFDQDWKARPGKANWNYLNFTHAYGLGSIIASNFQIIASEAPDQDLTTTFVI